MNAIVTRALFEDAFQQVLDNKIFRVLLVIACLLVAPTFLVGLREDRIVILFGWYDVTYAQFLAGFGGGNAQLPNVQATTIQAIQELVVDTLCGSIGMIFCIAATAIFVPRLMERGYADTLFSKPVARWKIFLTQYVSGLLFVSMLAAVLVGGMYVGLLLVSGYNDPGFLWSIFTLSYLFALLHSVSMLIGVVTRSTVASILLTTILFMFTGCVHKLWQVQELHEAGALRGVNVTMSTSGKEAAPEDEPEASPKTPFPVLRTTVNALHHVLPKTNDADYVAQMLRKATAVDAGGVEDVGQTFAVPQAPPSFDLERPDGAEKREGLTRLDLSAQPATWIHREDGREVARVEIQRKPRAVEAPPEGEASKRKPRKQSAKAAAEEFVAQRKASGASPAMRQVMVDRSFAQIVAWRDDAQGLEQQVAFFSLGDWMYEIRAEDTIADGSAARFDAFLSIVRVSGLGSADPYASRFGWTSELEYNAFYSLGSSILFAVIMLVLGNWKLSRVDF